MGRDEDGAGAAAVAVRRRAALENGKTGKRWTAAKEAVFFEELAATCNISHAAGQAGMAVRSAYHRKHRNPAFAARWVEALEAGYTELETLLLRHAINGSERTETVMDADGAIRQVKRVHSHNHALASRLLGRHAAAMERYRAMMAMRGGEDDERMMLKVRAELARVGKRLREAAERAAGGDAGEGGGAGGGFGAGGRELVIEAQTADD
ncbi:MAG TPA: hypothetical protein VF463_20735 [Sphingobium sp.]